MEDWTRRLERIDADGLRRSLRAGGSGEHVERGGRTLLNLAGNNYLGLSGDPRVVAAAAEAAGRFGVGAGASRLITGNLGPHEDLEAALAASRGTEAALVFSSGYAANVGVLSALAGRHDAVFADALCHASLLDGIRLSGADLVRYRHDDLEQLARLMAGRTGSGAGRSFIVTEGVFSMDGDVPDLTGVAAVADRFGATMIVDDAHGGGVLGPDGRGTIAAFGLQRVVPVQIGTLSKALGCQGGYVAGDRALIDLLINRARSFVFSTGLSPAVAAAARVALSVAQEEGWRRDALREHGRHLRGAATAAGFEVRGDERAPMLLVMAGEAEAATDLASAFERGGVLAPAIRPPTVPAGTSRIRLAPMATHTREQIGAATAALSAAGPAGRTDGPPLSAASPSPAPTPSTPELP